MFIDKEEGNKDDMLVEDVTLTLDGYNIYFKQGDVYVEDRFVRSNVTYSDLYEFVKENELTLPNEDETDSDNIDEKGKKSSKVLSFVDLLLDILDFMV